MTGGVAAVYRHCLTSHERRVLGQQERGHCGDLGGLTEPSQYSSRYVEDGSFVRLQNITVGYAFTLPRTSKAARIYLSGDNLLLFTPYTGYDPEVFIDSGLASRGMDYLSYPRARTFTTGFRIQF